MLQTQLVTHRSLHWLPGLLFIWLSAVTDPVRAELPTLGDPTLGSFSSKEEARIGQAFYQMLRANLDFVNDLQLNHYLKSLGQKLASHSDAAGKSFRFFIIKSPVINAFAGPDAYIGIHSGLIMEANNESQLAGVIAHEIAHVSQRHIARAVNESGQSAAATFATVLAAILLGSRDPEAGQAILLTGLAGAQQASLNFTRQNEYEADRVGIGILGRSGINPQGMVEFFQILLAQSRSGGIEYLRTHPLSTNRVSEAKNRIGKNLLALPHNSDDFRFSKARLTVLTAKNPENIADRKITNPDIFDLYRKAIALIKTQRATEAIALLKNKATQHSHPWIKLALAEAYATARNQKQALAVLNELSGYYPGYLPVTLAYAKLLTNNKRPQQSITLLQHQLQLDDSSIVHKALAQAYFMNGQISAAQESTGDQYSREGYIELALQQFENAMQQPEISSSTRQRLQTKKQALRKSMANRQSEL